MKGDIPAAALRLSCALPVRTHEQQFSPLSERQNVNNFRRVVVNGTRYQSITEAARDLRVCRDTIRRMIDRGEGRAVK